MLMREVRYGINLGLGTVTIDPWGAGSYSYHLGDVNVDYSPKHVTLNLPGSGTRSYTITGLLPSATYKILATDAQPAQQQTGTTDGTGALTFTAPTGPSWTIHVMRVG
jgi:hypothetical protein